MPRIYLYAAIEMLLSLPTRSRRDLVDQLLIQHYHLLGKSFAHDTCPVQDPVATLLDGLD